LGTAQSEQVDADVIGRTSFSNSFNVDPLIINDISADGIDNPVLSYNTPATTVAANVDTALVGLTQTTYLGALDTSASD
jgi:hypothetical protein